MHFPLIVITWCWHSSSIPNTIMILKYQIHYFIHDMLVYILFITLKLLGCHIHLGHLIGKPCLFKYPASGKSFVVIDISGVHEVGLDCCGCRAGGKKASQLLHFHPYPVTIHSPNTAMTFWCLCHFQFLSFETKFSGYEYFQTLVCESPRGKLVLFPIYLLW